MNQWRISPAAQVSEAQGEEGTHGISEKLDAMATEFGDKFLPYKADLTDASSVQSLSSFLIERNIDGCVINAGGPPTGRVEELKMEDWDAAYASTLRWKIQLTNALLPSLKAKDHGRLLFVESVSIKQILKLKAPFLYLQNASNLSLKL